jgi:spore germination protein
LHIHLVQPGDTPEGVARHYRITPEELITCNELPHASFLLPGQCLAIPSQRPAPHGEDYRTYQVQAGDTLRSLAARLQIPYTWLALSNNLADPAQDSLQEGDILLLPESRRRNEDSQNARPIPGLLSLDPRGLPQTGTTHTSLYHACEGLCIDAAGRIRPPDQEPPDRTGNTLLLCTLDGSPYILPDVAKAILRSQHTQNRILDHLGGSLQSSNAGGVIFAWQSLRPEVERDYLDLVREAGRRLRPLGLITGLFLSGDSPLLRHTVALQRTAAEIDHFFYEPARHRTTDPDYFRSPPPPLIGVTDAEQSLKTIIHLLPPDKTWLVIRPQGVLTRRHTTVQTFSPHQALRLAYAHGTPLNRDASSGLLWYRLPGEGGMSVWLEDLYSLLSKWELLKQMNLQGLALWEVGAYFPEAWHYLHEQLTSDPDDR